MKRSFCIAVGVLGVLGAVPFIVYGKNLGPQMARLAPRLAAYDPDLSWHAP